MLRAYGPNCDGSIIDPGKGQRIPDDATWIDLEEPTREEDKLVERVRSRPGADPRGHERDRAVEPALRAERRALHDLERALRRRGRQTEERPVGFVLTKDRLVTVRYVTPKPVRAFQQHARREHSLVQDALTALYGILDAIVDRLADELESAGSEIEKISAHIFAKQTNARRIPADRLTALLTRIGRAQTLLAKVRETAVSTGRLLSFLSASSHMKRGGRKSIEDRVGSLSTDVHSLIEHS